MQRNTTDDTTTDMDVGVVLDVTVFTAAKDGTDNDRDTAGIVDGDNGVTRKGRIHVILVNSLVGQCRHTTTRSEHHTDVGSEITVVELGKELLTIIVVQCVIIDIACLIHGLAVPVLLKVSGPVGAVD